jgi:uncharacterized membrane protein YfcA
MELIILGFCAILTSVISAVIGMGGGVTLLSVLSVVLPYQLLIPIHGAVQLVSNISRTFYLRKNIKWNFAIPFIFGTPIGFLISYFILKRVTDPSTYFLILAFFILYTIFKPKRLPHFKLGPKGWFLLGIASGVQGSLIGATGPLIAMFYLRDDISKEEVIATKAFQQIIVHLLKIPLFLSLDFNYIAHWDYLVVLCTCALVGSFIGIKVLHKVNEKLFKILFKSVLFFAAIRLIYKFIETI